MMKPTNQPIANSIASENKSADKATSEHQAVAEVKPTRSPTGLLDLPPELRLLIFRHLLVPYNPEFPEEPELLPGPALPVNILRTSRLIHCEASAVLYRENTFAPEAWYEEALTRQPRVMAAIQNVWIRFDEGDLKEFELFSKFSRYFGNPSVTRGTLTFVCGLWIGEVSQLRWLARELCRFSNFWTLKILVLSCGPAMLEYFTNPMEPALGRAYPINGGECGVLFHPLDHRNRSREESGGNWADCLDEIDLEWNHDSEPHSERGDNKTSGGKDKGTSKQKAKKTRRSRQTKMRELANKGARGRKDGRTRGKPQADDATRKKTKGRADKHKQTKTYNLRKRGVNATT